MVALNLAFVGQPRGRYFETDTGRFWVRSYSHIVFILKIFASIDFEIKSSPFHFAVTNSSYSISPSLCSGDIEVMWFGLDDDAVHLSFILVYHSEPWTSTWRDVAALNVKLRVPLLLLSPTGARTRIFTAYLYNATLEAIIAIQRTINVFTVSGWVWQHAIAANFLVNHLENQTFLRGIISECSILTELMLVVIGFLMRVHQHWFTVVRTARGGGN
jgi:hypothetical protein